MKTNNKIYTAIIAFALLSLCLVVFFIWPLLDGIEKDSKNLISAKKSAAGLAVQAVETENFRKNYDEYKPNFEKLDRLFVDPANPVDFIKFLEDSADSNNLTSQISLPPANPDGAESQDSITLQFSSKGNFADMENFLKGIENGPYLLEVENLTIQNSATLETPAGKSSKPAVLADYSDRKVDAVFSIKVFTKQ